MQLLHSSEPCSPRAIKYLSQFGYHNTNILRSKCIYYYLAVLVKAVFHELLTFQMRSNDQLLPIRWNDPQGWQSLVGVFSHSSLLLEYV